MHEPSIQQWTELYEVGKSIKKAAPWEYLWDTDIIAITLPDHEKTVYCSVMGRNGECFAIGLYVGNEGLLSFYNMLNGMDDNIESSVSLMAGLEQNCLLCNFGDREELDSKDREILKKLDIRFRGRNEWIYFRSMKPGKYPWFINSDEAEILIQTLKNLIPAFECINENKIAVNFEEDEILLRRYSSEKDEWINEISNLPEVEEEITEVIVADEDLIKRLSKKKKSSFNLEFDVMYLPIPVQENKNEAPFFPKMILIADIEKELILSQEILKDMESIESDVINIFSEHILTHGKPASVNIYNEKNTGYIRDLCEKLNIKISHKKDINFAENLLLSLMNSPDMF